MGAGVRGDSTATQPRRKATKPELPIEPTAKDTRAGRHPEMRLIKRIAFHDQP